MTKEKPRQNISKYFKTIKTRDISKQNLYQGCIVIGTELEKFT